MVLLFLLPSLRALRDCSLGLGAVLLVLGQLGGCQHREPPVERVQVAAVPVRVQPVERAERAGGARLVAVAEPWRRSAVGTSLMARVAVVNADEGARVARGATLVRLETSELAARKRQVAASASATAAQAHLASREFERASALGSAGVLPAAQVEAAEASQRSSRASEASAQAALSELDVRLGESVVRAPFDALVVQKRTEVGSFAQPGQPLIMLEDDSSLRIVAAVADRHVGAMKVGETYPVALATGEQVSARLETMIPSGDPRVPGLTAHFRVPNEQRRLRSGVLAHVRVPTVEQATPVFLVPEAAVVRRGGLSGVFLVQGEHAQLVWCALEESERGVRVLSGLQEGDRVVLDASTPGLADGRAVVVQP